MHRKPDLQLYMAVISPEHSEQEYTTLRGVFLSCFTVGPPEGRALVWAEFTSTIAKLCSFTDNYKTNADATTSRIRYRIVPCI